MRIADDSRIRVRLGEIAECERHYVQADGRLLEVLQFGEGDPIVLVPGLAGGGALMTPLAARLSRQGRVFVPCFRDDRGALSLSPERQRARGISDYARDLGEILDALRLERPVLVGVSFGGAVALEYAVEHMGRLGGLVLWGADSRFQGNLGTTIARRVLERYPLPSDNRFVNQFFNLLHGRKPEPGPLAGFVVERCWETDQSVMARRLALLEETYDVSDRLWRIDAPTVVLAGTRDVVVAPDRQATLASSISGARFESVEGAGHIGFLTHQDSVARGVRQAVREARRV